MRLAQTAANLLPGIILIAMWGGSQVLQYGATQIRKGSNDIPMGNTGKITRVFHATTTCLCWVLVGEKQ